MTVIRQDAWSANDDLILAEVTLRHIREGGTQLAAFEEVGERIGRTAAACGFRWNSTVRKQYEPAIQIAKSQRQRRNQVRKHSFSPVLSDESSSITSLEIGEMSIPRSSESAVSSSNAEISIDEVIRYLRHWKHSYHEISRQYKALEKELRDKDEELSYLRRENDKMKREMNVVQSDYAVVNDDYKTLLQIMDRARKMSVLLDDEHETRHRFKMDANGNLERMD